jgi:translation initiation factor IF-1
MRDSSTASKYVHTTALIESQINERLWNARLTNGKQILAHLPMKTIASFENGSAVSVRMSLCDFSHGEIQFAHA